MEAPVRVDISAYQLLGSDMGISQKEGLRLSKRIKKGLDAGAHVVVSMRGISFVSLAFLEAAFGTLAKDFGRGKLRTHLHLIDEGASVDLETLRRVMDVSFKYFETVAKREKIIIARLTSLAEKEKGDKSKKTKGD